MSKTIAEIVEYSERLDKEEKALVRETLRLAWYMRGGITANEAYMLTFEEREAINEIIKENFEWTKDTGQPFI